MTGKLRFILKRRVLHGSGCAYESFETIEVDVPELRDRLLRGGLDESQYDVTDLIGVEVLGNEETDCEVTR